MVAVAIVLISFLPLLAVVPQAPIRIFARVFAVVYLLLTGYLLYGM